jgi:tetratricopeptide (TPR) repeat protein
MDTAAPEKQSPAPREGKQQLSSGIKSYEEGNYKDAARLLQDALTRGLPDRGSQIEAHKYLAFIYCMSGRNKECTDEFKKALALDPKFELQPSEAGHPLWGPVFSSLKGEKATPSSVAPVTPAAKPQAAEPARSPSLFSPKEAQASSPPVSATQSPHILVASKTANLRAAADGKSKIIAIVKQGQKVEALEKSKTGDWIRCKLPSGLTGWIHKDLLKEAK